MIVLEVNLRIKKKIEKISLENEKIQYKFIPKTYVFSPGFHVGVGASIKPNLQWLLSQLGISDEHIIPSSLFEILCIGLETFLESLPQ